MWGGGICICLCLSVQLSHFCLRNEALLKPCHIPVHVLLNVFVTSLYDKHIIKGNTLMEETSGRNFRRWKICKLCGKKLSQLIYFHIIVFCFILMQFLMLVVKLCRFSKYAKVYSHKSFFHYFVK